MRGCRRAPAGPGATCARGAGINDDTIPKLTCKAVAGCANNQLLEPKHADDLRARGILYAPDYVINAGGIINVSVEFLPGGYDEPTALERIDSEGRIGRATLAAPRALARRKRRRPP